LKTFARWRSGVADQIAAAMGWSVQYTLGVLRPWKIDAGAKELAAKGLAKKAAVPMIQAVECVASPTRCGIM
jgi:hypothetical protein